MSSEELEILAIAKDCSIDCLKTLMSEQSYFEQVFTDELVFDSWNPNIEVVSEPGQRR